MAKFTLTAQVRDDEGKGASRRLRRTDRVPAIIYGSQKPAESLSFDHNELWLAMKKESFFSSVLTLKLAGADQPAIIKAVQRHPVLPRLVHLDFQRVSENEEIRVHVPLHFLNETISVGVKTQGGALSRNMIEIEVACLPKHLPEFIAVDVQALEINHALHLSQLTLPEGVRIPALSHGKDHDLPVVSIQHMRVTTEEDLATAAPTAPEATSIQDEKAAAKAVADGTAVPAKPGDAKAAAPVAAAPAAAPAAKGGDKKK